MVPDTLATIHANVTVKGMLEKRPVLLHYLHSPTHILLTKYYNHGVCRTGHSYQQ